MGAIHLCPANVLVPITFSAEGLIIVREALENGIYDNFVFTGTMKNLSTIEAIGSDRLGDMYGIAAVADRASESSIAWEEAFVGQYGDLTVLAYVKEIYDATTALALGSPGRLRTVTSGSGEMVIAEPEGVQRALDILANGDEINYKGASTTLDWDEKGDLLRGHVGVWRFTTDGKIEDVKVVPFGT